MANLAIAFREQFRRDEAIKWKDSADIWSLSQLPSQSVEDFISKVQLKALRAKLSEEQVRFSIIRGLLPEIRQSVLQHSPATVDDIKRWATVAEAAKLESHDSSVVEAVKRLEDKFNHLCTSTADDTRRARSQSPRVRFQDNVQYQRRYSPGPRDR